MWHDCAVGKRRSRAEGRSALRRSCLPRFAPMFKHEVPWNIHACLVIEWKKREREKKSVYFSRIRYGTLSRPTTSRSWALRNCTRYMRASKMQSSLSWCMRRAIDTTCYFGSVIPSRRAAYGDLGTSRAVASWIRDIYFAASPAPWRIIKMCTAKPRFPPRSSA